MTDKCQIVEIENLNSQAQGVARLINNQVCFVPLALPSETVEIEVNHFKKGIANANLIQIKSAAKDRRIPPCLNYPLCGGCDLQHANYQAQLEYKLKHLKETLKRIGKLTDRDLLDAIKIISTGHEFYYRNNARYFYDTTRGKLGFYQAKSKKIVAQKSPCMIVAKPIDICRQQLETILINEDINTLKSVRIRHSYNLEQLGIVFCVSNLSEIQKIRSVTELLRNCLQTEHLSLITVTIECRGEIITVLGNGKLKERINGVTYRYSISDFFQVNTQMNEILLQDLVKLVRGNRVLDLYCGSGSIALQIAAQFPQKYVKGIEIIDSAVREAVQNAKISNIENVQFISNRAEKAIDCLKQDGVFDTVIVDPPRKGLDKTVIDYLKEHSHTIVYMSCNPATLARDLSLLQPSFLIENITAYDMFPQTMHVETVVLMSRL